MPAVGSALQEEMALQLAAAQIGVMREYQFDPTRQWRSDFVLQGHRIGIEVDGGAFRGRHAGGKYLRASHERQNAIVLARIWLLRFTKDMIRDGTAIQTVKRAISALEGTRG